MKLKTILQEKFLYFTGTYIFFTGMQRRGFREWSEYIGQDQQVHP